MTASLHDLTAEQLAPFDAPDRDHAEVIREAIEANRKRLNDATPCRVWSSPLHGEL